MYNLAWKQKPTIHSTMYNVHTGSHVGYRKELNQFKMF
jgi:hypothetical protein